MSSTATTYLKAAGDTKQATTVLEAIKNEQYASEGAPFTPLLLKFTTASKLQNGWNSEKGDTQISFYTFPGATDASDQFRPLGDFATINNADRDQAAVMLVAPMTGHTDNAGRPLLAHPTDFEWILDDKHSDNKVDIAYFWPTAPEGYEAVGICVGFGGAKPSTENYWCVSKELLQSVSTAGFWSDAGQGWKSHNGDLNVPNLANQMPGDLKHDLLLAPTTFLSVEKGGNLGRCLVISKPMLAGITIPVLKPVYNEQTQEDDETDAGLVSVAVLPCTVIDDPNRESSPLTDPFYYLSSEPYWKCLKQLPSSSGDTVWSSDVTVGTVGTESTSFQETSSLTIGAETGVEAAGVSAKISVSYTDEMQVGTSSTKEHSSQGTTGESVPLKPASEVFFIWQEWTSIVLYRTGAGPDGGAGVVNSAPFQKSSVALTHSPS